MQREILFRVWDGKKYHYPEANDAETNHHLQIGSKGFFILWDGEGNLITDSIRGGILEQFTGLLDRHENKIFEGDIDKDGYVVTFYNNAFQMCLSRNGEVAQAIPFWIFNDEIYGKIEIIGNIHENK